MSEEKTHKPTVPFGVLFAGIGLYFVLVGVGVLPIPGGEKNLNAPLWVVTCAGLAFLLGGIAVIVGALGGANEKGELPKTAPAWMGAAQRLCVLAIFVALAAAITWVAFGPGERQFSGSLPLTGSANEFAGRGLFGFGAAMMWLAVLVILSSWRKTPGRGRKS
jgi:hypothetical protein